jgi:hypothetical protein
MSKLVQGLDKEGVYEKLEPGEFYVVSIRPKEWREGRSGDAEADTVQPQSSIGKRRSDTGL